MKRTINHALVFAVAAASTFCSPAMAQNFPVKPLRIVVGLAPGGGTDIIARMVGQRLSTATGQQIIIDNRAGASGNIAAEIVAKSPADGYTLIVVTASHAINPSLFSKMNYDPIADFSAITQLTAQPYLFVVNPGVPAKSVKEFIALAKSRKGGLTYASSGSGLLGHLGMELLKTHAKFEAVHVPYKGSAMSSLALLGGETDYIFDATAMMYVHAGKLKVLAVAYTKRWPTEPNVPSMTEAGYPGVSVEPFFALVAPANTPLAIRQKLNDAARVIGKRPDAAAKLAPIGVIPQSLTLKETADFLLEQGTKWGPVVKASGAQVD